jgi:hypothetical protein
VVIPLGGGERGWSLATRALGMAARVDYEITDKGLETAVADKLLETKDWFAIKGLINKYATVPVGGEGDRPVLVINIPQGNRAAFLEALETL